MGCREYDQYPYIPGNEYLGRLSIDVCNIEVASILNDYLAQTKGPALEIGGPTRDGFRILENIDFPNKLIISNVSPESDDIANIDIMNLPYGDGALGCIIASRLPISLCDTNCTSEINATMVAIGLLADDISKLKYDKFHDRDFIGTSPRIALIAEARRTLEVNGLLITKHLLRSELNLVKDLGFDLLYHIKSSKNEHNDDWQRGEYVFRLKDNASLVGTAAVKTCIYPLTD